MFCTRTNVPRSSRRVEKGRPMFKTKLAALPMIPLAFFCSVALAQKPSASIVKSATPTLKPQTPSASIAKSTTPKPQTRSASIAKSTTPTRPKPSTPATVPQPNTEPRQGISAPKRRFDRERRPGTECAQRCSAGCLRPTGVCSASQGCLWCLRSLRTSTQARRLHHSERSAS